MTKMKITTRSGFTTTLYDNSVHQLLRIALALNAKIIVITGLS